jgi:hypothetical protein
MAKKGDVKLTLTGLEGVTPIGVTISYAAGGVPVANVDLAPAPPGVIKISGKPVGVLENVDAKKRRDDITIDISVDTFTGTVGARKNSILKFVGLLDGLTISNVAGGNTYQAVVKHKAQILRELTTLTPGLHPASLNVYKIPLWGVTSDPDQGDNQATRAWTAINSKGSGVNFDASPIETYTDIMKWIIGQQDSKWKNFLKESKLTDGKFPFARIFEDPRYIKALKEAKTLFDNVDYSAVIEGTSKEATSKKPITMQTMGDIFMGGANILLDNYMNFLANMGCTLIFSNTKMFVVPVNSVINQEYNPPRQRKLQDSPNVAYPADYSSYSYNDSGYRDLASVIVTVEGHTGGAYVGDLAFERGACVHYTAPAHLSNASGVLVVQAHPFMMVSSTAPIAEDVKESRQKFDQSSDSLMPDIGELDYDTCLAAQTSMLGEVTATKKEVLTNYLKTTLENYAETKYYQERYHDRRGSITLDFNPDWVPGTGGSLYIRETEMFIAFYVTEVTHRIDMSPTNSGSAITVVNFSCGRMGTQPLGVDEDIFLGYDLAKEKAVQKAFIADNK